MGHHLNTLIQELRNVVAIRFDASYLLSVLVMSSASVLAQQVDADIPAGVAGRYHEGTIQSIDTADAALVDVGKERPKIEARFIAEEQACHPKFFATSCLEKAKERRRSDLMQLRKIEIEAHTFKRQARVAERDQALANKQAADRLQQGKNAEVATENPVESRQQEKTPEATRNVQTKIFSNRSARHETKLKQISLDEAADAKKRMENVAAYEAKTAQALARQKKIESNKAEKEQKRKSKQAMQTGPQ